MLDQASSRLTHAVGLDPSFSQLNALGLSFQQIIQAQALKGGQTLAAGCCKYEGQFPKN